jgi:hypothetical protein
MEVTEWRTLIDVDAAGSIRVTLSGEASMICSRATMDEASRRITDTLWSGMLPTDEPVKMWGGLGSGVTCDGCDAPILPSESEHEVEMPDGRTLRFHVACRGLWQVLQKAMPPRT